MYGYFKGVIEEIYDEYLVLEVGGIGYNIFMSSGKTYERYSLRQEAKIYTYTLVREDAINLYGFETRAELELFKKLISVSGVGPKVALSVLSVFTVDALKMAIFAGDSKLIAKAPGIGAKTASRLILELKDKVDAVDIMSASLTGNMPIMEKDREDIKEAIMALSALGYSNSEAKDAVTKAANDGTTGSDALLKGALKYM